MRLLRLLATGRSLVGLDNGAGRYQLPNQCPLPKFGSHKNPFRSVATADSPVIAAPVVAAAVSAVEPVVEVVAVSASATPEPSVTFPSLPVETQSAPISSVLSPRPPRCGWLRTWMARVKEWFRWPRRSSPGARLVVGSFSRGAVQGELSLDRIKVVRNDLSDTDLEIVRAKKAPSVVTETPTATLRGQNEATAAAPVRAGAPLFGSADHLT
jgi:hypothetical protein